MGTSILRDKNIKEYQAREINIYLHLVNIMMEIQYKRNKKNNLKAARKKD